MRILIIGSTGTIGSKVVEALKDRHDILAAHRGGQIAVDIDDADSIKRMFEGVGSVDAVVVTAGGAAFAPLEKLTDADFNLSLHSKLMGQVNVVRFGLQSVRSGGSFTLTSGVLASHPMQGSAAVSLANAGIEGFARAAALELSGRARVNVVSPGWISETLVAMGRDGSGGTPAAVVAKAYVRAVEGSETGAVIDA
jgi:NAD(P)-dependent dehydrogenase (short-subunit alcohol dehydrogenase family)